MNYNYNRNLSNRPDFASVVAFYGIDNSAVVIHQFLQSVTDWFRELGHPADKIAIHFAGQTGRIKSFSRQKKQIDLSKLKKITGFELYATFPNSKIWWMQSYAISQYESERNGTHVLVQLQSPLGSFYSILNFLLKNSLINLVNPMYGIGFNLPLSLGPGPYVVGVNCVSPATAFSGEEYEKRIKTCRWGDFAMPHQLYEFGIIRDVYPLNFLNRSHLDVLVGGVSFEEWVLQGTNRGALIKLGSNLMLWEVCESDISDIRLLLKNSGILFDWKKQNRQPRGG